MSLTRSLLLGFLLNAACSLDAQEPFQPTLESLENYRCPDWFRDAKFGIYVHWGIYSVPEMGEWYGREMYMEGHEVYRHHLETYGHPSVFGYKDFIPMWKAEHFDPDAWLELFEEAGAKYFTPCATHHDSFDIWDSDFHTYNSVRMGPKKDLLGMMREATLRRGLRFGVTTHMARSISWMQTSHGSDKEGDYAGVPYDGADPRYQDLYMVPYGDDSRADTKNPPVFWREWWRLRMLNLVDKYRPDFVYLDSAVPFAGEDHGQTGLRFFAEYYNRNIAWHGGTLEGVITHKSDKGPERAPYFEGIATLDIERGRSKGIREEPWQTDDSIGPWGYRKGAEYKDANAVVDKLIDVVSKNGNYLLNVPPRADGTFDDETIAVLKEVGAWFRLNGEAIYGTRPWAVFGEGPSVEMGHRDNRSPYTDKNIRFTRSPDGGRLYAILLGVPEGGSEVLIESVANAENMQGKALASVRLLGSESELEWQLDDDGLRIVAPPSCPSDLAVVFCLDMH